MRQKNPRLAYIYIRLAATFLFISLSVSTQLSGSLVSAAGMTSFSLSPSSGSYTDGNDFTLTVKENSGSTEVNATQVSLSYDANQLQYVSLTDGSSAGSPFDTCFGNITGGGGSVDSQACATIPSSPGDPSYETNPQTVAVVTFKALASSVTSAVTFATGTSATNYSGGANTWNGITTGGSYTLVAATTTPTPPAKNPSSPKSSTGGGSSGKSSSSGSTTTKSTAPTSPTTTASAANSYLVAVKVINKQSKPVYNAQVKLGNSTAVSDKTGLASFIGISAGKYDLIVIYSGKTYTLSPVTVLSSTNTASVQQFSAKLPIGGSYILVYIGGAVLVVLLVSAFFLMKFIKRPKPLTNYIPTQPIVVGSQGAEPVVYHPTNNPNPDQKI